MKIFLIILLFPFSAFAQIALTPGGISPIIGSASICYNATATLYDGTTGGVWLSSDNTIATIGSATGIVTGVNGGTCTVTYALGSNTATAIVTVNSSPIVAPTNQICVGSTYAFTDATTGGTWTSSNTSRATVGSTTGIVGGVASLGGIVISYILPSCTSTFTITVNALPANISGSTSISLSGTNTIANTCSSSVTWAGSNPLVATLAVGGLPCPSSCGPNVGVGITGVSTGTINLTAVNASGCYAANASPTSPRVITVSP